MWEAKSIWCTVGKELGFAAGTVWLFIIPFWVDGQDFPFRGDWDLSIGEILMKSLCFSSKPPAFQTMRFISALYHHWYFKISRAFSVIFSFKAEAVETIMLSLQTCLASTVKYHSFGWTNKVLLFNSMNCNAFSPILKGRQSDRNMQKEMYYLLVHSSNTCSNYGWTRLKAGA